MRFKFYNWLSSALRYALGIENPLPDLRRMHTLKTREFLFQFPVRRGALNYQGTREYYSKLAAENLAKEIQKEKLIKWETDDFLSDSDSIILIARIKMLVPSAKTEIPFQNN